MNKLWIALIPLFIFVACGKGGSGPSYPAIAPIVNASLPASLQSKQTQAYASLENLRFDNPLHIRSTTPTNGPNSTEYTLAATSIGALFSNYYSNINDGKGYPGFINNLVLTVDKRMTQLGNPSGGCLKSTPQSYTVDLSSIDPMLKFTLKNLQCNSTMNGNAAGSGVVFGSNGQNYSMWLSMGQLTGDFKTAGGFMVFANVANYGSTSTSNPETVDGMMVEYFPNSQINRISITRFLATPTTNTFELFFAGSQVDMAGFKDATPTDGNGTDSLLGSGFRMISDGTHIYSDGLVLDRNAGSQGSNGLTGMYYNYNVCLKASDLSVDTTASDCQTLANAFTLNNTGAVLNTAEVLGNQYATIGNGVPCASGTTPSASNVCIPGYTNNSSQTPTSSTIATLLNNIFPVSNASAIAAY